MSKAKRALLVIDVQNEYFTGKLPVVYPAGSLEQIIKLMQAAHQQNIPIILVQHSAPQPDAKTFIRNSEGWQLHEKVLLEPHDLTIEKQLPGSFTGTNLQEVLQTRNIDTVVICGYMTQMCCDTTARQAVHRGFQVEFMADATATLDIANYAGQVTAEELHRAILVTQAMRFSQVINTADWIKMITG